MQKATQKTIPDEARARLEAIIEGFQAAAQTQVGYPVNQDYDYSDLLPILQFSANNIGDPFQGSNFHMNTHDIEREVIAYFADLMRLEQEQAWGYVTSGGTEGNMYGLYMGRETFPGGTVYFSQDTHYSVVKLLRLLNIRNVMIRSRDNGEIDYYDLRETLSVNRGVPAIVVANIGTTMKGAVDDLDRIRETLDDLEIEDRYIHADAALSGMILPFVQDPQPHAPRVRRRGGQHVGQRPQAHRLTPALRNRPDQTGLRGPHSPVGGARGSARHHNTWLPQRPGPHDHMVRPPETRHGRLPPDGGRHDGDSRVRGPALPGRRHPSLEEPELGHRRPPAPGGRGLQEMADRPLRGHSTHHNHAPRHQRKGGRACRRLPEAEERLMERIVIMARNETGVIADIAGALANAGVNIESLDTERTGEQGIVTLTTNDTDRALLALKDAGFRAATDDSLIFRLPDEPGALARVAKRFRDAGLNIQSLHILDRRAGRTVVALTCLDRAQAEALLDPDSIV